jgi:DNA mismatch repair protein MutL
LIKVLPQFIANRIAAGEVIGRPEAVVKELIENSIDAGAQKIFLRIKDAGRTLIQVTDDASGMNHEDALLCMERHSTSKISTAEDLECIKTLGFRGEALASICAVAQVELRTRTAEEELGTLIKNHGSELMECSKTQTEKGTSVTVRNLFYNTPARRNFLKSDQTEFKHIHDTFIRLAISHPGISFNFVNDDEEIFDLPSTANHPYQIEDPAPGGSGTKGVVFPESEKESDEGKILINRLNQIYGQEYVDSLIEVQAYSPLIKIHGFISKPAFSRKTKQDQFLFLNNRYVTSRSLSYAAHLAYEDLIEKGDYPDFFLFLYLDPHRFDVNVHPSKLEVKFDDEKTVFNFIRKAVRGALDKNDLTFKVKLGESSTESHIPLAPFLRGVPSGKGGRKFEPITTPRFGFKSNIHELQSPLSRNEFRPVASPFETSPEAKEIKEEDVAALAGKFTVWQFQYKYIMYQLDKTLMIIDQHAAHERILYEQTLERLNSNANLSQQLLIPVYVELSQPDYDLALLLTDDLRLLGFNLEFLSKRKIKVLGIPADVRIGDEERILQDLLNEFKANDVKFQLDKRDNLAKSYACKHAIRSGDRLTQEEMLNLIDRLMVAEMPYVCPHGRPTIIKIPIEELDKKFERS